MAQKCSPYYCKGNPSAISLCLQVGSSAILPDKVYYYPHRDKGGLG